MFTLDIKNYIYRSPTNDSDNTMEIYSNILPYETKKEQEKGIKKTILDYKDGFCFVNIRTAQILYD